MTIIIIIIFKPFGDQPNYWSTGRIYGLFHGHLMTGGVISPVIYPVITIGPQGHYFIILY